MNEGNCAGCGEPLHTKIRATIHPIKGVNANGDPIRGLEKDVNACGECVGSGEDLAMTMAVKAGTVKAPKKPAVVTVTPAAAPAPAPAPSISK